MNERNLLEIEETEETIEPEDYGNPKEMIEDSVERVYVSHSPRIEPDRNIFTKIAFKFRDLWT